MNTLYALHLSMAELEAGLDRIRQSPKDDGRLEMIVRRPKVNGREVLEEAELDPVVGLLGDNWKDRGSTRTSDGSAHPDMQINVMNSRVIDLIAQDRGRWSLAGDQLFLDLDLSADNLLPGTQLQLGTAVIQVSPQPHLGCRKFVSRFGLDAMKFVNSELGQQLHLRGINARVVKGGVIRAGCTVRKIF